MNGRRREESGRRRRSVRSLAPASSRLLRSAMMAEPDPASVPPTARAMSSSLAPRGAARRRGIARRRLRCASAWASACRPPRPDPSGSSRRARAAPASPPRAGLGGTGAAGVVAAAAEPLLQVRYQVADGAEPLQIGVRDLEVEFLLDLEHQLDGVEGIEAEILAQRLLGRDRRGVPLQLTGQRAPHLLRDRRRCRHGFILPLKAVRTREALLLPKPKAFRSATLSGRSWTWLEIPGRAHAGSGSS